MKEIKIHITEKMQTELNKIRKECGFEEEPIKKNYTIKIYSFDIKEKKKKLKKEKYIDTIEYGVNSSVR